MGRLPVTTPRGLAASLIALCALAPAASADTLTVTSTADSGPGTIRAALAAASDGDTIAVPPGTYAVTSSDLDVTKGVTLHGSNARATILHADGDNRVLSVTAAAQVRIEGVTVENGGADSGAGIRATGPLRLDSVSISGNDATGDGGGLAAGGATYIEDSTIAGNSAANGAGIVFTGDDSTIVNTTIAGNTATGNGGGLQIPTGPRKVELGHVTLVRNEAAQGGGIWTANQASAQYYSSILAENSATTGPTCWGDGPDAHYVSEDQNSTSGDVYACDLHYASDRHAPDLHLGPLADNGGPTDTVALGRNSAAIDSVQHNMFCPSRDQRGVIRQEGSQCDAGAFELTTPAISIDPAENVTPTTATVHGVADPRRLAATAWVQFGETALYDRSTAVLLPETADPLSEIPSGPDGMPDPRPVTFKLTGLRPATRYHMRGLVTTPDGSAASADRTFTTPPAPVRCVVPKLKGLTLGKARAKLTRAHCRLGSVTRLHRGKAHRRAVVVAQSPKPGAVRAEGTAVRVTLSRKKR